MVGLTDAEVKESRLKYGSNCLVKKKQKTFFNIFVSSLADPMIKILLIVLAIKFVFLFADADWFETLGIIIAIFIASFISSISEYGSNKAFALLVDANNNKYAKVKRNGIIKLINLDDIVVGDIVYLNGGDYIPADGELISGEILVNESSVNGESKDALKSLINSSLYKGTIINSGEGIMRVTNVGVNTLFGKIADEVQVDNQDSPLKVRLRHLAGIISKMGYVGAFLVFFSYLFSAIVIGNDFNISMILDTLLNYKLMADYLIYALTLAVTIIIVSVPEGLPMMIALVLSINMKKMIKKNVLVKKMDGIETAGSLNYLLTDKTGTLTNGVISVYGIVSPSDKLFNNEVEMQKYPLFYEMVGNATILNNDVIKSEGKIINGNSTDKALVNFFNFIPSAAVISRESFSSDKKYSSVSTKEHTYYKGAPEVIISRCKYDYDNNLIDKSRLSLDVSKYMHKGFRVIALSVDDKYLGLVLLKDDIRLDAKDALELINKAGVRTIMITGDSLDTALFISRELNMIDDSSICLTSSDLEFMSDDEVKNILSNLRVVARAKPSDKSRLVRIIEDENLVVGMTGDGINDAPALKKASVGFAMGSGSDVAKEAADIIILDDSIYSIGMSILYGRTIFKNIRKFLIFQLTVNICAMMLSIIGPFISINTPVTVMQMLWINMIMDTVAAIAFSYEEPDKSYMMERPKERLEPIINKYMSSEIIMMGLYSSILCIMYLKIPFFKKIIRYDLDDKYFLTSFFALFIFMGIFNAFNARTNRINLFSNLKNNKVFLIVFSLVFVIQIYLIYYGGSLFRTYGLSFKELIFVLLIAFSVIPFDILRKIVYKKKIKFMIFD